MNLNFEEIIFWSSIVSKDVSQANIENHYFIRIQTNLLRNILERQKYSFA